MMRLDGWTARTGKVVGTALCLLAGWGTARGQCEEWADVFRVEDLDKVVHDMAVFDGGAGPELYACGKFGQVARWDGDRWHEIAGLDKQCWSIAAYQGELYVSGGFTTSTAPADYIARWNGSSWSEVGSGLNGYANDMVVYQGELYVGGSFSDASGVAVSNVARWNGTSWADVGGGVNGSVKSMVVYDAGAGERLYVGGNFSQAGTVPISASNIAAWNGTTWENLGLGTSGSPGWVRALAVHDEGAGPVLFAGGNFSQAGGGPANHVARWNGITWTPLTSEPDDTVKTLASHDGFLWAGGWFTQAGTTSANHVARWNGSSWSALGAGLIDFDPQETPVSVVIGFDDGYGPALFAGGAFTKADGLTSEHVAKWYDDSWWSLGCVNDRVLTTKRYNDGRGPAVFVGGEFTTAGGRTTDYVARWDGQIWSHLGAGVDDRVTALGVYNDGSGAGLYVGGDFVEAGGAPAAHVARWDDGGWSAVGAGLNGNPLDFQAFDDGGGGGSQLYVVGTFTTAGGSAALRVARWNGSSWSTVGGGFNDDAYCLEVFEDELYAGGAFTHAGGTLVDHLARWSGSAWEAVGTGTNGTVIDMAVFSGGGTKYLYVGGDFVGAGSQSDANYIARWSGTSWDKLQEGTTHPVHALATYLDGDGRTLFVGGEFTGAGIYTDVGYLVEWTGMAWTFIGPRTDAPVRELAEYDDGAGPSLFMAGDFTHTNGIEGNYIGRYTGACFPPNPTYCTAGTSASGCQALISATGVPSATATSGFDLTATTVEGDKTGLFFYGVNGRQAKPWGNGTSLQCVVPPVRRGGILSGSGTNGLCNGVLSMDLNARWCPTCSHPAHNPGAGAVVQAQLWYRDPFNPYNQTTSLSDAIEFTVEP